MLKSSLLSSLNSSSLLSPENTNISPCNFSIGTKSSYFDTVSALCCIVCFSWFIEISFAVFSVFISVSLRAETALGAVKPG